MALGDHSNTDFNEMNCAAATKKSQHTDLYQRPVANQVLHPAMNSVSFFIHYWITVAMRSALFEADIDISLIASRALISNLPF